MRGLRSLSPLPLQVEPRHYREPDLMFVAAEHADWIEAQRLVGADLVVEVVSGDRERDFVDKRADYARLGVAEYWIVDPRDEQIHVLTLADDSYAVHGVLAATKLLHLYCSPAFRPMSMPFLMQVNCRRNVA